MPKTKVFEIKILDENYNKLISLMEAKGRAADSIIESAIRHYFNVHKYEMNRKRKLGRKVKKINTDKNLNGPIKPIKLKNEKPEPKPEPKKPEPKPELKEITISKDDLKKLLDENSKNAIETFLNAGGKK